MLHHTRKYTEVIIAGMRQTFHNAKANQFRPIY